MKNYRARLFIAWKKLILAYLLSFVVSFTLAILLVKIAGLRPERLFDLSSKRIAYALPVFNLGIRHGIDLGLLLFVWNTSGAMITLAFIHAVSLFDPARIQSRPRVLRSMFCGRSRMKLLCYLPGCAKFDAEALRRLYVWLMVPLLGMILLGVESGVQAATTTFLYHSFYTAVAALFTHGMIEIPALALAGAVPYSASLLVGEQAPDSRVTMVVEKVENYKKQLSLKKIAGLVIVGLMVAGLIEAHITPLLM